MNHYPAFSQPTTSEHYVEKLIISGFKPGTGASREILQKTLTPDHVMFVCVFGNYIRDMSSYESASDFLTLMTLIGCNNFVYFSEGYLKTVCKYKWNSINIFKRTDNKYVMYLSGPIIIENNIMHVDDYNCQKSDVQIVERFSKHFGLLLMTYI